MPARPTREPRWGTPPWKIDFTPPPAPVPASVDIAIIGAGFTGLAAAAWLRHLAPEKSVAVFESAHIGAGASGRTGGMALAETAAGNIRGLGDVLAGLERILGKLGVDCDLALPGAWEIGRGKALKNSPIDWKDSGRLRVVKRVPGGTLDPGKLVSGLARAASALGATILENHRVAKIDWNGGGNSGGEGNANVVIGEDGSRGTYRSTYQCSAGKILFATNAVSLDLTALEQRAEPKLTLAIATEPLAETQFEAIGLAGGNPFYTVDLPYLWGRVRPDRSVIFGAGLLDAQSHAAGPPFGRSPEGKSQEGSSMQGTSSGRAAHGRATHGGDTNDSNSADANSRYPNPNDLTHVDVATPAARELFASIERRIHNLHPALAHVGFTHRWGGPILFQPNWRPIFTRHPRSKDAIVLGAYAGHGVALSTYLGAWAAEALLGRRPLPHWGSLPK
jgi:glycine/D-amino acid oxidase-like deaminating enzyme